MKLSVSKSCRRRGGAEVQTHQFLISVLDRSGEHHPLTALPPNKEPRYKLNHAPVSVEKLTVAEVVKIILCLSWIRGRIYVNLDKE